MTHALTRRASTAVWLTLVLLAGRAAAQEATTAPPLGAGTVSAATDLGVWDDVYVPADQDVIILRRGEDLFALDMTGPLEPKRLRTVPAAAGTRISGGVNLGKRYWLFLNSGTTVPCALDVNSGDMVRLDIPGLTVPGSQAPSIGAHVVVPHANAALLAVSGGDRATWPRDGNHSVYFRLDLTTGRVERLPIGWDLYYFAADERTAVFETPDGKPFERRPRVAIALDTGERVAAVPDRHRELCAPYSWTYTAPVKPLYEHREGKGEADFFAGVTVAGRVVPVALGLTDVYYLATAEAADGFAGFRLRREGQGNGNPGPLWVVPVDAPTRVARVADGVTDFALLSRGGAVFVTAGHGHRRGSIEAFYRAWGEKAAWNLLAGVERLPPLDQKWTRLDYVHDRLMVSLVDGFGTDRHTPLVLCRFAQYRGEARAIPFGFDGPRLESVTWRRTVVVTADGRRFTVPLGDEGSGPDQTWLHRAGRLLTGTFRWHGEDADRQRQVHLVGRTIERPRP